MTEAQRVIVLRVSLYRSRPRRAWDAFLAARWAERLTAIPGSLWRHS